MLAEKLLLHVLIILSPILMYIALFENKQIGKTPYLTGVLHGIAAILCMSFPFYSYGLYWDLRYVPLVLSILYGGPIAGGIVFFAIMLTRTIIGGDALLFGYLSGTLAAILPFILMKYFWKFDSNKRIRVAVSVGLWPGITSLSILMVYVFILNRSNEDSLGPLLDIASFGVIYIVGLILAVLLHEAIVERNIMKNEIHRAEKLNTLGELAASIAHEVRNPLTVVKGFLQLMHKQEKGQNQEYLALVLSELGRAEAIINDYLNFAKPQFKKVEEVEISEVLSDVILLLKPLATKQDVQITTEIRSNSLIKTDRNQMKQAFVNLIKNAIEASIDGGKISIRLYQVDEVAYIKIKDNGKGMSKEQLSRIGTLFYTTKDKGTGLGTMVSLRIIESMEGKLSYSSKIDEGTEVTITIPVHKGKMAVIHNKKEMSG
ncbi:ATP-binding protein [Bacillus timonensis]|nr:ATP-binding protein [Bacillus timonensis]